MTGIQWTDATWNPVTGCSKVSPGCANCYAETMAMTRLRGREGYPGLPWTPENAATNVVLRPERLDEPLLWRKPRRVFVNSMSDLFHELVPDDFLDDVFAVMGIASRHTFQVLTKRPERMRAWASGTHGYYSRFERVATAATSWMGMPPTDWPLPNVWLGTSIENRRFVGRADDLRATPAAIRFISAEPLLEALDLDLTGIDWLIVGGESGPGARPMELGWVRNLVDLARVHGTAVFVKQLGQRWAGHGHGGDAEAWPADLRIREYPA